MRDTSHTRGSEVSREWGHRFSQPLFASMIGPPIGGFITTYYDWRWIFWIDIPFGLLAISLAGLFMPNIRGGGQDSLDWLGFGLSGIGLIFGNVCTFHASDAVLGDCPRSSRWQLIQIVALYLTQCGRLCRHWPEHVEPGERTGCRSATTLCLSRYFRCFRSFRWCICYKILRWWRDDTALAPGDFSFAFRIMAMLSGAAALLHLGLMPEAGNTVSGHRVAPDSK
ncbi:MAG: MFS transporter [Hyphomicrobiaceae bacterium]